MENIERKMARTADELAEESSESEGEGEGEESSEDEDVVPYNPKNLPLGWDGKPIPYWLYKLHGLNISYTCEICGNTTYRGPKAFQRHFSVCETAYICTVWVDFYHACPVVVVSLLGALLAWKSFDAALP